MLPDTDRQLCGHGVHIVSIQSEDFTLREALLLAKLRMQEERRDDGDSRAPGSTDTSDSVEANLYVSLQLHNY